MYRLYSAPNTYAISAHAMLEEIGARYELIQVDLSPGPTRRDPEFLKVSPHGRVPALATEDGTIFESGAIVTYLAERHPDARLAPPPGDPARGLYHQWLFYLHSTLQPEVFIQFHPENYFDGQEDKTRFQKASMERLKVIWEVLDHALEAGPYFLGSHFSACDICLATQALWPEIFPDTIDEYANVRRTVTSVLERPALERVITHHLPS
ncbi:MAG: glutathione S-transferase family protein [Candidatus Latescibacteria bacterium]|jgi:glutathione S-transferase|nr:glutathione S-transferase family protein [Candidatus Latescibacterota bacterium]